MNKTIAKIITVTFFISGFIAVETIPAAAVTYQSCAAGYSSVDGGTVCEKRYYSTTSANWTAPTGVTSIDVMLIGGGGGSGKTAMNFSTPQATGGGGGGEVKFCKNISVSPSSSIAYSAGAGAWYTMDENSEGTDGDPSVFGSCSAVGGQGSASINATGAGTGAASGNGFTGGTSSFYDGSYFSSGGGAGAGANGGNATGVSGSVAFLGGAGGAGLRPSDLGATAGLFVTDTTYYGGGGSGAGWNGYNVIPAVSGGTGGGGSVASNQPNYREGTDHLGGGAAGTPQGGYNGSKGGDGAVVVRYAAIPETVSTTVGLQFDDNEIYEHQTANVTATITASSASGDPTGSTAWYYCYGAVSYPGICAPNLGTPLSGSASVSVVAGTAGDGIVTSRIEGLTAPSGAGYYLFVAEYSGDSSFGSEWNSAALRVIATPTPTISGVEPNVGSTSGGTFIVIDGSNFTMGTVPTVTVGGVACTGVNTPYGENPSGSYLAATLTCTTGAHAAGLVDVVVTNPNGGTVTYAASFTYEAPAGGGSSGGGSTVDTGLVPSGILGDGQTRIITGRHLSDITSIKLGGVSLVFKFLSDGTIQFELPANLAVGTYDLQIESSATSVVWQNAVRVRTAITKPVSTNKIAKTIAGFAGNSASLSKAQMLSIKKAVAGAKQLTCTGSTSNSKVTNADRKLALARAKSACAYAKKLVPSLITKVSAKPSISVGSAARRVVLTITK